MPDAPDQPTLQQQDLQWLACPFCRQSLVLDVGYVLCSGCSRRYPIVDGIPILLIHRAY